MKEYIPSMEDTKANPTIETQERIIKIIQKAKKPISITSISKLAKTSFYQTRTSISFLYKLGVLDLIISSGNITLVRLKGADKNATN